MDYASWAWINTVCPLFLIKPVLAALRDDDNQRRLGHDPVLDPRTAGVTGADYWAGAHSPSRRRRARPPSRTADPRGTGLAYVPGGRSARTPPTDPRAPVAVRQHPSATLPATRPHAPYTRPRTRTRPHISTRPDRPPPARLHRRTAPRTTPTERTARTVSAETSIDPRTGHAHGPQTPTTTLAEVATLAAEAARAAPEFDQRGREFRARLLEEVGASLEARREEIVAVADRETGLGPARLGGELTRTVHQARHFAQVLREGSYLEAAIDHAADTPLGPGPDLRRMLLPLGPVAVFGASNFPLAFSVPGGDTVSALAAGCPVVIKAHESHPATSRLTFAALTEAAARVGAPDGLLALVHGREAGAALVTDPHIKAVGFTGSTAGGRALRDLAASRDEPVPFYAELAGINPVVITEPAARERRSEIAAGVVTAVTASGGQLCTKPGLIFLPSGEAGDALVEDVRTAFASSAASPLLNSRIHTSYHDTLAHLTSQPDVYHLTGDHAPPQPGYWAAPHLLSVPADRLTPAVATECFGPVTVLVRYRTTAELLATLGQLPASLAAALHTTPDTSPTDLSQLTAALRRKSGRVVYNGFPTGVRVSWAQHHGGPWPATTSTHTSVGATAIRRFLRPFTWQDAPEHVLPPELHDSPTTIPRRVNGTLQLPK